MDVYAVYKKTLLLIIAYGGTLASFSLFPSPRGWGLGEFIGALLFSPLQVLAASFCFVAGFLGYSIFVQDLIRLVYQTHINPLVLKERVLFLLVALLSILHLLFTNWLATFPILILASLYGIMDADLNSKR
ncbi:hypothetical protein RYX56_03460 [Alkalihalophilus lindianensis]|uniref:Tripartite tricarboxylate transporter TctB family protein n=1 Tax=Alkalihalophilus lindianensis TaxID=1630542 RepID=A0ABU3X6C2_9BACI|nr:hypothetical protein [Alkalihalophilus lindianensis]MDV2683427.1 hypothetical protein [Alkalihalophilus lindianensis]